MSFGRIATLLELPLVRPAQPLAPRDAIVVLGAPLRVDGSPSRILRERIEAAAALYRAGGAPIVIASGGVTGGTRAEADAIAEALGDIPTIIERTSRSTAENARCVAALLPPCATVWLVTQPFHGARARYLFQRAGLDARLWQIADSLEYRDRRRAVRWLVREYGAWAWLLLRAPLRRR